MSNVLLDSNILIEALNNKDSDSAKKLKALLENDKAKIFVTPLISYEVLRGINWDDEEQYVKFNNAISLLGSLDIDNKISQLASDLFRLEKYNRGHKHQESKKIDKHNFDLVHFSTAKIHKLTLISNDKDMESWEDLYNQYKKREN